MKNDTAAQQLLKEKEELTTKLQDLQKQAKEKSTEIEKLKQELENNKNNSGQLNQKEKELQEQLNKVQKELKQKEMELEKAKEQLKQEQKPHEGGGDSDASKARITELEKQVQTLTKEKEAYHQPLSQQKLNCQRLKQNYQKLKNNDCYSRKVNNT
ncbi:hypothetical protein [Streptococcus equi]|uniref:hypothetical protein n=1 Tax=Streptococcus equi TaxID=1336 RepID=UPI001E54B9E0|nr:hypothetical protein [Streptococcus equi]MCD3432109.1 hypothetical protein [Streptococcus equi subsp. zooepidemicus]